MPEEKPQLVDLLEVFHARQLREMSQGHLWRLRDDDNFLPGGDLVQRGRLLRHYERLHQEAVELLRTLGDLPRADLPAQAARARDNNNPEED